MGGPHCLHSRPSMCLSAAGEKMRVTMWITIGVWAVEEMASFCRPIANSTGVLTENARQKQKLKKGSTQVDLDHAMPVSLK